MLPAGVTNEQRHGVGFCDRLRGEGERSTAAHPLHDGGQPPYKMKLLEEKRVGSRMEAKQRGTELEWRGAWGQRKSSLFLGEVVAQWARYKPHEAGKYQTLDMQGAKEMS